MLGAASIFARSFFAMSSAMCFSYVPAPPIAPGSSPPWPGSIATVSRRTVPRPDFGAVNA